jgi:hypothetical protein
MMAVIVAVVISTRSMPCVISISLPTLNAVVAGVERLPACKTYAV